MSTRPSQSSLEKRPRKKSTTLSIESKKGYKNQKRKKLKRENPHLMTAPLQTPAPKYLANHK